MAALSFSARARAAMYRAMFERRDRRHFARPAVAAEVMPRLPVAARHGPSVGVTTPWRFVRVARSTLLGRLRTRVEPELWLSTEAPGEHNEDVMRFGVEGIEYVAEVRAAALADGREVHVAGRRTLSQMDFPSGKRAIQDRWLAARAEGMGVGWVSMLDPAAVAALLNRPSGADPIALRWFGPVHALFGEPMLRQEGCAKRSRLEPLLFEDTWGQAPSRS